MKDLSAGIDAGTCRTAGHVALHALCQAVHATCIVVRDLIMAGNVCEVRLLQLRQPALA